MKLNYEISAPVGVAITIMSGFLPRANAIDSYSILGVCHSVLEQLSHYTVA